MFEFVLINALDAVIKRAATKQVIRFFFYFFQWIMQFFILAEIIYQYVELVKKFTNFKRSLSVSNISNNSKRTELIVYDKVAVVYFTC